MNSLTVANLAPIDGEPRVLDTDLASALGMRAERNIRPMIAANRPELETHGEVCTRRMQTSKNGGRPGSAYYLNEGQALVICALSRTSKAAEIRKALIDVFLAYRRGEISKTVHVNEHWRRPPVPRHLPVVDMHARFVSFFKAFRDQPEALADWACDHFERSVDSLSDFSGVRR